MQTAALLSEQFEREMDEKAASWLASILAKELEKKERIEKEKKPIPVGRKYMKRKVAETETPIVHEVSKPDSQDKPYVIVTLMVKATKPKPKECAKHDKEIFKHDYEKYAILYAKIGRYNGRLCENVAYLVERGYEYDRTLYLE
ncbi:hypothetical protein L1987_08534 [Smallanthus sonchifolius]|uniref:Uncharacterized protein n=1 Tax=Smallanthus sonchifolius TaxID=185202 RepID=A0ACB9JM14_9ASTR|nr:hypothetical protein L1987_08534 [Smallanthus sonchifolius]